MKKLTKDDFETIQILQPVVNRVQIHVSSPRKDMPKNKTLSPLRTKKPVQHLKKKEDKMFKTKQIKEIILDHKIEKPMQLKNVIRTFYSTNSYKYSTASGFRKSKRYDADSNTVIMSKIKSDLPDLNHLFMSQNSDKSDINLVIKSGASLSEVQKIQKKKQNKKTMQDDIIGGYCNNFKTDEQVPAEKVLVQQLFEDIFLPQASNTMVKSKQQNDSTIHMESQQDVFKSKTENSTSLPSTFSPKKPKAQPDYFSQGNSNSNIKIIENKVLEAEKYIVKINGQISSRTGKRLAQENSAQRLLLKKSEQKIEKKAKKVIKDSPQKLFSPFVATSSPFKSSSHLPVTLDPTIEKLDIQSIPREVHISSKSEERSIQYLQLQMRKDKFFHKEFNPQVNDDPKVKIMQAMGTAAEPTKEDDILGHLTRTSKNDVIQYNKFEKLQEITQSQLKKQNKINKQELKKQYYSVPKFTKQLFWNLKLSQEQDGQGQLATYGLMGLKQIEGYKKENIQHMSSQYQQQLAFEKAKRLKKYVQEQQIKKGQQQQNANFQVTKVRLLQFLEEGVQPRNILKYLMPRKKSMQEKLLASTIQEYDQIQFQKDLEQYLKTASPEEQNQIIEQLKEDQKKAQQQQQQQESSPEQIKKQNTYQSINPHQSSHPSISKSSYNLNMHRPSTQCSQKTMMHQLKPDIFLTQTIATYSDSSLESLRFESRRPSSQMTRFERQKQILRQILKEKAAQNQMMHNYKPVKPIFKQKIPVKKETQNFNSNIKKNIEKFKNKTNKKKPTIVVTPDLDSKSIDSNEAKIQEHKNDIKNLLENCDNSIEYPTEFQEEKAQNHIHLIKQKKQYDNVKSKVQNTQKQTVDQKSKMYQKKIQKQIEVNQDEIEKWQRALDDIILMQKDDKLFNGGGKSKVIYPYQQDETPEIPQKEPEHEGCHHTLKQCNKLEDSSVNIQELIQLNEISEIMDTDQIQVLKDELKEMAYKQEVLNRLQKSKDYNKLKGTKFKISKGFDKLLEMHQLQFNLNN